MLYHILAVGDVVGEPGLRHLEKNLRPLQKLKNIAFTVVNGENASGVGVTPERTPSPWATTPLEKCSSGSCWTTFPGCCGPPTIRAGRRATAAGFLILAPSGCG